MLKIYRYVYIVFLRIRFHNSIDLNIDYNLPSELYFGIIGRTTEIVGWGGG